jgi:hypothetical protein
MYNQPSMECLGEVWGGATTPLPRRQSFSKVMLGSFEDQIQGTLPAGLAQKIARKSWQAYVTIQAAPAPRRQDPNKTELTQKTRSDLPLPFARDTDAKFWREI